MKQKMKRALWMLMCLMAMVSAGANVTVDGLRYSLRGAYASVCGVAEGNTSEKITVPATIKYEELEYTVNEVSSNAFTNVTNNSNNKYVKEIILPNTITVIGEHAFVNSNITSVKLSEGIVSIEVGAFKYSSITSIIIPASVTVMNRDSSTEETFYSCNKLRSIIYLGATPPLFWTATSNTYVLNKKAYSEDSRYHPSINPPNNIIEMISFSDDTFAYTGKAPNVTWTNNVEGYTAELTLSALPADVGTHNVNIPAKFTKDEENFEVEIPYSYTIQPVTLKAKVGDASRQYGEDNPAFSISYEGFVNGDDESVLTTKPTVTTTAKATSDVGTYAITASGGKAKNYTFEYEKGTLIISKAPLTINVNEANRTYGQVNPTFSLGYVGLKNGESTPKWITAPTFTTDATKTSDVGAYTVRVACEPTNYQATMVDGKLNVTQAPLTISANDATRSYCGVEPAYSFKYTGFKNGETENVLTQKPTMSTEATATSNVGDYTLIPQGAAAKNYAIRYAEGTLTITQCPLAVKVASVTRGYGENNPAFTFIYEGFVNGETEAVLLQRPTASTSAQMNSTVGTYEISVNGGRAFNYALTYESGQLTITPQPLKVSVGNYERAYNEEDPRFTLIYEGFMGSDTESSLQTKPVATTTATKTSNVGTYPIEVTGGYSPNYVITYSNGVLTIVQAEQTFTWEQDLTNLIVNQQVELNAIASSGLPVTYTMEPIDGAEIYPAGKKTYLECKAPCEFVIKAVQNGNDNYYPTQRITKKVIIVDEGNAVEAQGASPIKVQGSANGFMVTGVPAGQTLYIYSDSGVLQQSISSDGSPMEMHLPKDKVYIVKAGGKSMKVLVK